MSLIPAKCKVLTSVHLVVHTYAFDTTSAWNVLFSYSGTNYYLNLNTYYVRCVRGQSVMIG
jgi:hypothetical protein